jgi:hypothetical protein
MYFSMRRLITTLTLAIAVAACAVPVTASASSSAVIQDCAKDGKLDHHYSQSDLRNAEKQLPTDVSEYTDCRDVINNAQVGGGFGGKGGSGGGGTSGGSGHSAGETATPADVKTLDSATKQARSGEAPTLSVAGKAVKPGSGGVFKTASAANSVPGPMLAALIGIAALSAAGGWFTIRRRLPSFAGKGRFPNVRSAAARIFRR